MNILIIPDIHGRSFWEEPINDVANHRRDFDVVIFLGDYFDPYPTEDISECQAISNWEKLYDTFFGTYLTCEPVFLIGNHDAHYLNKVFAGRASGSRKSERHLHTIEGIFEDRKRMFQIAFDTTIGGKKVLFTHAGINRGWAERYKDLLGTVSADSLNNLTKSDEGWLALADVGEERGGWAKTGGPMWADVSEHYDEDGKPYAIDGYDYEIFAHTRMKEPVINDAFAMLDAQRPFILADDCTIHEYSDADKLGL
jgi:predicted phosphodiesterase